MFGYVTVVSGSLLLSMCTSFGVSCPPVVTYTEEFQEQASQELPNAGPAVQQLVNDYGAARDAARVCQSMQR